MNEKNATILTERQTGEGSGSGLMRCYNKQTSEKLGFDSILKYVARKAISEEAKEYAFEIVPQTNPEWIETSLNQVQEFKSLLEGEESFPLDGDQHGGIFV